MSSAAPDAFRLQQVEYRYRRRSAPVLNEAHIAAGPGEFVSLVGPSGSGKSTVLYLIGLLLRPTNRHAVVEIGGQDLAAANDLLRSRMRARSIGFVFQDALLDPRLTVLQNIMVPTARSRESTEVLRARAAQLCATVGLDAEVLLPRRANELSGGQAQRIALCRALICEPEILLCDEPTGNLDEANARHLLGELRRLSDGGTCILIATHDSKVVSSTDRSVQISEGRCIAS